MRLMVLTLGTASLGFTDAYLLQTASVQFTLALTKKLHLTHVADTGLTLVGKLTIDQDDADIALRIEQAGDERGIFIDQNGNDAALNIDSETTTAEGIIVDCSALTTGKALMVNSNSASSATRQLVRITNDHASATGTTNLYVDNDSDGFVADFHGTAGIRSATGISFGTDTAAANLLDDYEEGTATIQWSDGTNVEGSANNCNYTKVGRMVTVTGDITSSGAANLTANAGLRLAGFPFAFNKAGAGSVLTRNLQVPDGTVNVVVYHGASGTYAEIYSFIDHGAYAKCHMWRFTRKHKRHVFYSNLPNRFLIILRVFLERTINNKGENNGI